MSGFPILDLVIGMIFLYFLLSIICSSAVELWFSMCNTRARLLEQWLKRIFDIQALDSHGIPKLEGNKPVSVGEEIMNHCMVTALSKTGKSTSYIDAVNFVSALLDKITLAPAKPGTNAVQLPPVNLDQYIAAIEQSNSISGELKRTILSFAHQAKVAAEVAIPAATNVTATISSAIKSDLDQFRERLENWYDTNANRLTGTLKRKKVLPSTFILGTIITIALNADTIEISKYLYTNKDAAKQLSTTAMNTYREIDSANKASIAASTGDPKTVDDLNQQAVQIKQYIDSVQVLNLPIGWKNKPVTDSKSFWNYFFDIAHIGGWLATILAICMGSPFWFDLLNKIANVRGVGPKPPVPDSSGKN
ncbi:MAG: hypothetical protein JWP81_4435 [Ferruginibacter sp.]|nr:hypothetical protein [Ferruginibacter sp.]